MLNWRDEGVVMRPAADFELAADPNERGRIQCFLCKAFPLEGGAWRIWYSAHPDDTYERFSIAVAEGIPGGRMERFEFDLSSGEPNKNARFALGNLPDGWRPIQPVCVPLPDGTFNLYFWAHAPGVVRFLLAKSADGRRFEVVDPHRPCLWHPNDRAVETEYFGTEGLTSARKNASVRPECEPVAPADMICNDATNVYLSPDGGFEMYTVRLISIDENDPGFVERDNLRGMIRVIERRVSDDGIRWSPGELVVAPDGDDFSDLQFYYLSVTFTEFGRIGMLGHYRVEAQTMDIEFCFSLDGIKWNRPFRNPGFPRREPLLGVYAASSMVESDGRAHLFYTGTNVGHDNSGSPAPLETDIRLATVGKEELTRAVRGRF